MQKFAIGQPVRRREDQRFITGQGCYLDDIAMSGMTYAAFVRSPHAHARIGAIAVAEAKAAPGVLAVYTHGDVARAGLGTFPTLDQVEGVDENGISVPPRHALTGGVVRFVGDPVAMVVAESDAAARAAADLVMVDYEDLPAAVDVASVLDAATPLVWPQFGSNRVYHFHKGDLEGTEAALAEAAHVVSLDFINNRLAPCAMEPRGVIGSWNESRNQYVLHVSGQAVFGQRAQMADRIFKVPPDEIRVIMPDVGGGFGAKNFVYPENVMVMFAARALDRPVKWVAERGENFTIEVHGRDHVTRADLGLDGDGNFLALRIRTIANMGAYLSSYATIVPTSASWVSAGGNYRISKISMAVDAVFTNTVPVDAYRGAGRPESAYLIERLVDVAAHDLGCDRLDLRRRNLITGFPHKSALGMTIDVGDFERTLDLALDAADHAGLEKRRGAAKKRGRLRGFGVSSYLEVTLGLPSDEAEIRFDDDGGVSLIVGSASAGQGHETTYMQLVNAELGIDPERMRYVQGDTGLMATGGGHGGARSLKIAGSALYLAAGQVREKALKAAGQLLEADPADIEFVDGLLRIKGTDRALSIIEVEAGLRQAEMLPDGVPATLTTRRRFERAGFSFPNGAHVAEVEVDPETGAVFLVGYTVVDDFGRIVNPLIASGQVLGGVGQGAGQALLESVVYDETGQLITGSFMDYALPRASDLPAMTVAFNEAAPTATNPLGVKGAGEAGATGSPPAIVNAVIDALKPYGIRHIDMPLTAEKVWRAIDTRSRVRSARSAGL